MNKEQQEVDALYQRYPIPRSWRIAQWTLSLALIGVALVMAWVFEHRWLALIPFMLASPLVTIRLVCWVVLRFVGKPANWPDSGPGSE